MAQIVKFIRFLFAVSYLADDNSWSEGDCSWANLSTLSGLFLNQ